MIGMQQFSARKTYDNSKNVVSGYLEQEVFQWSPEKIILKTYDLFIVSCKKKDVVKMNKILISLMTALNFDQQEMSTRFYRLYEYCQKCVSERRYDDALLIIQDLRETWATAFSLK